MKNKQIRGRFAPSPSGRMHLGNLYAALLAWLSVRKAGGTLVLRMEDLDPDRCRRDYTAQLADDLCWLGLDWDEGFGKGGAHGPYLQSERTAHYARSFEALEALGLVYPCYCSRSERLAAAAPHHSDGRLIYNGRCRGLAEEVRRAMEAAGRRPAWRVMVPKERETFVDGHMGPYTEELAGDCGDFIVRRSDGIYAYQLAVVADDAAMEVNQVVRGRDLLSSTPRQRWLYRVLGLRPPEFFHVPLLLAADGRRLSKRDRDLDMGVLRAHHTRQELAGRLAWLAGLLERPEPVEPAELIPLFCWERVPVEDITVPDGLFLPD